MKNLKPITCRVDELIAVNKFEVDEENAHIELVSEDLSSLPDEEFGKLIRVCPAGLYREDENGIRSFDYAGCLECGTCRIACEATIIKKWEQPRPFMGVSYRFG
ncbi:ferredoxin family protein [Adlercreutzia sp. ZJ138]|uniref:ferredoxin family protein n=1 Tax=Adlercreutzia sp. ZJ138 TaxID=2709405 RepID=UPI0013EA3294|nr:ferredoxin family protein [Adlercreutzia sp. ZJ138]